MASEKAGGSALQHVGDYTYDPRDSLGRGSFADVFKGKDKAGNTVAIKRIHQNRLKKESSRKLLRSEVSIMQISKHPNIVRLFEYIDTAEHVCLVMEVRPAPPPPPPSSPTRTSHLPRGGGTAAACHRPTAPAHCPCGGRLPVSPAGGGAGN